MKAKKYWVLAMVMGICGYAIWVTNTSGIEPPKFPNDDTPVWIPEIQPICAQKTSETLLGLKGVRVYVELVPGARIGGLTKRALQTDTELQIRQNGIKVFSSEDSISEAGRSPKLHIVVGIAKTRQYGGCGYSATAALWQWAELFREPGIFCSAITWMDLKVGFSSMRKAEAAIKDAVRELVDKFINDYLAANPKESSPKSKNKNNK